MYNNVVLSSVLRVCRSLVQLISEHLPVFLFLVSQEKRWKESWGIGPNARHFSSEPRMRYDEIWWDMYADVTDISDISDINGRVISGGCLWPRRDAGLRRQDDHHLHQWQRSVEGFGCTKQLRNEFNFSPDFLVQTQYKSKRYDMTQQTFFDNYSYTV